MKEACAVFPPIQADLTHGGGVATPSIVGVGYDHLDVSTGAFKAGCHTTIDLSGLTIADKLLKINSINVSRLPSFDNTTPKSGRFGIYQVTDMHLVTTSPIVVEADVNIAGIAPAQSSQIQMVRATEYFGAAGYTTNNGYPLATPGIIPGDSGNTNLPFFNLDPNMIVFCQTDVLGTFIPADSSTTLATMFVPIDSSRYGMGDMAALETLHCYRFIYGTWLNTTDGQLCQAKIGPSIIEMKTEAISLPTLERFQVMDTNFNTTNPLID